MTHITAKSRPLLAILIEQLNSLGSNLGTEMLRNPVVPSIQQLDLS